MLLAALLALSGYLTLPTASQDVAPGARPANVRVLDAATGEPIADAEVFGVHEVEAPVGGEFWSRVSATTDADGRAFLPPTHDDAPYGWCIVRAEGYAVSGSTIVPRGERAIEVDLHPSIPARVRLVDFLGRPLPLVHLGLCVGCGHTPDVEETVTDRDGWVTFRGVGEKSSRDIADVYPVGDSVLTDYLGVDWDAAQQGGFTAVADAGATLRGRLRLPDGGAAAGYFVGISEIHRGPWARTDVDGRFALHGVSAGHSSYLQVKDPKGEMIGGFDGSRIGVERSLRIPDVPWEGERTGDVGRMTVSFDFVGRNERTTRAPGLGRVPVEVWDPRTGWARLVSVPFGEPFDVELVAGDYEVEVGGKGSPFARVGLGPVHVPAGDEGVALDRELAAPRIVSLEVTGRGDAEWIHVRTATGEPQRVKFDTPMDAENASAARAATGVIEAWAVPAAPFGLWIESSRPGRYLERLVLRADGERGSDDARWSASRE